MKQCGTAANFRCRGSEERSRTTRRTRVCCCVYLRRKASFSCHWHSWGSAVAWRESWRFLCRDGGSAVQGQQRVALFLARAEAKRARRGWTAQIKLAYVKEPVATQIASRAAALIHMKSPTPKRDAFSGSANKSIWCSGCGVLLVRGRKAPFGHETHPSPGSEHNTTT